MQERKKDFIKKRSCNKTRILMASYKKDEKRFAEIFNKG